MNFSDTSNFLLFPLSIQESLAGGDILACHNQTGPTFRWAVSQCRDGEAAPAIAGDTWTWTAIEADTKPIVSWLVGGRDGEYAMYFMDDLRSRLPTVSS